ncbi:hypothetical protein A2U01_0096994, partial [Trifolium medium]|nr:hypothetical protein [Trifolium medium]
VGMKLMVEVGDGVSSYLLGRRIKFWSVVLG